MLKNAKKFLGFPPLFLSTSVRRYSRPINLSFLHISSFPSVLLVPLRLYRPVAVNGSRVEAGLRQVRGEEVGVSLLAHKDEDPLARHGPQHLKNGKAYIWFAYWSNAAPTKRKSINLICILQQYALNIRFPTDRPIYAPPSASHACQTAGLGEWSDRRRNWHRPRCPPSRRCTPEEGTRME